MCKTVLLLYSKFSKVYEDFIYIHYKEFNFYSCNVIFLMGHTSIFSPVSQYILLYFSEKSFLMISAPFQTFLSAGASSDFLEESNVESVFVDSPPTWFCLEQMHSLYSFYR